MFEFLEKPRSQPLLYVFLSISLLTLYKDFDLLANPISWRLLLLPVSVLVSYLLVYWWKSLIWRINSRLSENDIGNWSPLIGCSILALCVLITFSSIANDPGILSFKLMAEPNFFRLSALYSSFAVKK
jgi:hypothetical protein